VADFEVGELRAAPGEVAKGHLGHVSLADSTKVGVPAIVVNGAEDGPTLVVTGSVHGTEINGTGALLRAVREIDPRQMRGRLVAIPSANPFAFQVGSYFTPFISPTDGFNLSSMPMWPGNPEGRLTERIAAIIGRALQLATHSIDVHSNPDAAMPFTLVNRDLAPDDRTRNEMNTMAEAWGFTVIETVGGRSTGVNGSSVAHGVPSMTPELTGDMFLREDNTRAGRIGITNVMKAIGILEGELEPQAVSPMQGDFVGAGRLTTHRGGLMWVRQPPGQFLREGDLAIEMTDVWGDTVEEIRMPFDGYCWSFTGGIGGTHAVPEGTQIAYLFRERG
jgi:uncharacterized protein